MVFWRSISRADSNDDLTIDENQKNESTRLSPRIVLVVIHTGLYDLCLNIRCAGSYFLRSLKCGSPLDGLQVDGSQLLEPALEKYRRPN